MKKQPMNEGRLRPHTKTPTGLARDNPVGVLVK
jgi:hypothetical protein